MLKYNWAFNAREEQLPPPSLENGQDWVGWLFMGGRGSGKTRTGAEWVRTIAERGSAVTRIALIGPTAASTRDVMVKGDSGILAISPPWCMPIYQPSKSCVIWPTGAQAFLFSAEEPERLRGPQFHYGWCDELAAWKNARETMDMFLMGLRLGSSPRWFGSTTPKPTKLMKDLVNDKTVAITKGSSYRNKANLAPTYFQQVIARYEGTTLGRQEIEGELLLEDKNALWTREVIESCRVKVENVPPLKRVVVGVDPPATSGDTANSCGIIVAGLGIDDHAYVFRDATAIMSPARWARVALTLHRDHKADRIVAERNNGGEMVAHTIRSYYDGSGLSGANVFVKPVFASRGKFTRAEPVALLFQQKRVHIVGSLSGLEDQMCQWDPYSGDKSPDALDAMVWAIYDLMVLGPARLWNNAA